MANNKYVGARYVPLIKGEWLSSISYEPLTVVLWQGNSYTSKCFVPVGVNIDNEGYWVQSGNYNAQVDFYRQDVQDVKTNIKNLENVSQLEVQRTSNNFNSKELLFVAHRGAESVAPQNTIPSTDYAGMMGYYGCECDLQVTSDKQWVLFHDDTLDFLTNGSGTVASKTLAEIKQLNIDYGPYVTSRWTGTTIPTLREFLNICSKWNLVPFLELKHFSNEDLPSLFSILHEYNVIDKVVLLSNVTTLKYCKDTFYSRLKTLALITPTIDSILEVSNLLPYSIVGVPHTAITKTIVEQITNNNLQCAVWTNGYGFHEIEESIKEWGVSYSIGGML